MADLPDFIESRDALHDFAHELDDVDTFAIDIESNGFYVYRELTCILTISTPQRDVAIDTLKLADEMGVLTEAFADPGRRVLLHGGSYDVVSLKRDFHYTFTRLFDTMTAAQLLGHERLGLADLVHDYLGLDLPKGLQRCNWGERPLDDRHLAYLAGDTHHLFALYEKLEKILEEKDLLEEHTIECDVLAEQPAAPTETFDPDGYRRIKEARDLSTEQRGALKALWKLRDSLAREQFQAPFRVLSNSAMVSLVRSLPTTRRDLLRLKGIGERLANGHGTRLINAIRDGLADPQPQRPVAVRKKDSEPSGHRPNHEQRALSKRIKAWRSTEAIKRGVGVQAVLPTPVLKEISQTAPTNLDQLASIPRLGTSRLNRYGAALVELAGEFTA